MRRFKKETDPPAATDAERERGRLSPRDFLRLLSYAKPYRLRLAVALLSLLISAGLGLAFPQFVRVIIDAAFVERNAHLLNQTTFLLIALFAGMAAFSFLRSYLLSYVGERVLADVRTQVYNHLTGLPVSFFAARRVGELTSRLSSDVGVLQSATTGSLTELLRQGLTLIGSVVIIAVTNPRLTLVMLAIVPLVILASVFFGRYVRRLSKQVQDRIAEANIVVEETFSAIRIVQSFVREPYERSRYHNRIMESFHLAIRRSLASGGFIAFIILVVYSGIVIVLWVGSRMVVAGDLTAGELIAFVLYTFVVGGSIGGMSELYGQFNQAIGASRRVFEILDTKPEIADAADAKPLAYVRGQVQFERVSFTYPDERNLPVLKRINIRAEAGEIIALVGPSGAGKSTLVTLLPRFYDVSDGAILVDGQDIRRVKLADLRGAIGIVPQETTLFGGTIRENIAYGKLEASAPEIEAAARAAHAHEFISEFPDGYETVVGERGVKLSGGQRQRIAIARALLKDPAILILDEATSSLDSESERLVQDALETLMQGRTTFVIAHRLSTVRRADRITVIEGGVIVEEGSHEALLAQGGLYKRLHDIQFKDYPVPVSAIAETE